MQYLLKDALEIIDITVILRPKNKKTTADMNITNKIIPIILACLGTPTLASDACIFAVPGGEPTHELERRQTDRIVRKPTVVPGFNGFVMYPSNRAKESALLHFNGKEILPINRDFPRRNGHTRTPQFTPAIDGKAFGFGSYPRAIFEWNESNKVWTPIDRTRDYKKARYDSGNGEVFVFGKNQFFTLRKSKDPDLEQLQNIQKILCSNPYKNCDLLSVRTHKENSIRFATFGGGLHTNSVWARLRDGTWKEVAIPSEVHLLKDLNEAHIISDNNLIKILPKGAHDGILLRKTESDVEFLGSLPPVRWHYHKPSGNFIGWTNYTREKNALGRDKNLARDKYKLHLFSSKIVSFTQRGDRTTTYYVKDAFRIWKT